MQPTEPRRLDALLSPAALGALALLLANDFVLKPAFHNALTGKLSDFAGLFLFAVFWSALLPRRRAAVAWATALGFVVWKSALSQPLIDAWNGLGIFPVARVVDATDLVALVVLPLAWAWRPRPVPRPRVRRVLRPAAAMLSIFAFAATSYVRVPVPIPDAVYGIEMSRLDALQRIYDLRLSYDWNVPPTAGVEGADTVTITLAPRDSTLSSRIDAVALRVEVADRGTGSTLRVLDAHSFRPVDPPGVRKAFEREVVDRLRRGETGPVRYPDFTAGRDEALRPRILAPTSLTESRAQVRVSVARPAYVAVVEVNPLQKWRVLYPTASEPGRRLEAGEHTLATACAARGAPAERIAAGEEVPPCGVAQPLTVKDMRERNQPISTGDCPDKRLVYARQRPNTPGTLVLLASDAPFTAAALRSLDGRCGYAYVFFTTVDFVRPFWRAVGARTWAVSSIDLMR